MVSRMVHLEKQWMELTGGGEVVVGEWRRGGRGWGKERFG